MLDSAGRAGAAARPSAAATHGPPLSAPRFRRLLHRLRVEGDGAGGENVERTVVDRGWRRHSVWRLRPRAPPNPTSTRAWACARSSNLTATYTINGGTLILPERNFWVWS